MTQNEGKDDLLRFLYEELNPEQSADFEVRLHTDAELREEMEEIKEVQQELDSLRCSPSAALINSLMRYARQAPPTEKTNVTRGIA